MPGGTFVSLDFGSGLISLQQELTTGSSGGVWVQARSLHNHINGLL